MSTAPMEGMARSEPSLEEDIVLSALHAYFGPGVRILNYEAPYLRKDYVGPASRKVQVGGALVIECAIFAEQEFKRHKLEIDDQHRLLNDENAITLLGAQADANWYKGVGITVDYCYDPRT